MANKNFNKQVAPARKKLAVGGRPSDMMKRPMPIDPRMPGTKPPRRMPRKPMPIDPRMPGPKPPRRMPKLPGKTRPGPMKGLTPEQIKRLKELMQKTGRPRPKKVRKKLMGGGSSSSREAMMHGFYNKDMGMGKKKK